MWQTESQGIGSLGCPGSNEGGSLVAPSARGRQGRRYRGGRSSLTAAPPPSYTSGGGWGAGGRIGGGPPAKIVSTRNYLLRRGSIHKQISGMFEWLKSAPSSTPREQQKVAPEPSSRDFLTENIVARLNQLETRMERVELASAETHMMTLNAVEKVIHQLNARTRKRQRDEEQEEQGQQGELAVGDNPPGSVQLARRFRRF